MAFVINTAINDSFILRDNSNVAITGKTNADFATVEAYAVATPATTAAVTITEIGSGEYRYSFTPTTAAIWVAHIVYNSGGTFWEGTETFDVQESQTAIVIGATAANGATLSQLVRRTSRLLGNLHLVTATSNGTTTSFVDNLRLRNPDNAFVGRELYFAEGTANNLGLTRFVTASSQSGTSLTFPAVTSNTASGDVAEIHNVRGSGWFRQEIVDTLNDVLRDASDSLPFYDREDIATAFDANAPLVTVPTNFRGIYGVQWEDTEGFFHDIPLADGPGGNGWWLYRGERQLIINGGYRTYADTNDLRIYGTKIYSALSADTDATLCNEEWLVQQALAHLYELGSERVADGTRDRKALYHQQQANQRRDLLAGPVPGDFQLVI